MSLCPPPTYLQQTFLCVDEQGSSLPLPPHCTIGFPWASLAAPALFAREFILFLPSSFSLALRRRFALGTRCHIMSMPQVAFLMEIRHQSPALSVLKGETWLLFSPLPSWEIIFGAMSPGSLMPRECQIPPQGWFLHLLPHLHCCAISSSSRPISRYVLILAFLRIHR